MASSLAGDLYEETGSSGCFIVFQRKMRHLPQSLHGSGRVRDCDRVYTGWCFDAGKKVFCSDALEAKSGVLSFGVSQGKRD